MKTYFAVLLCLVTGLAYGTVPAVKYTGGDKIVTERLNVPKVSVSKKGIIKKGDPHNIYVLYQGNTEVDIAEITYSDWPYKVYRDGSMIAEFTDEGPQVFRDTGLTKGQTYSYQIKIYWEDTVVSESDIVNATTGEVCGQITKSTVWREKDSPFIIGGSLPFAIRCAVVTMGWGDTAVPTLTIEPGVEIKINPDNALGGSAGNIFMMGKQDTMIKISSNTGSRTSYIVTIQDSCKGTLEWVEVTGAMIGTGCDLTTGSLSIKRSRFTDDSIGIRCKSPCTICSVFVADCNYGICSMNSGLPQISYSEITSNKYGIWGKNGGWFNVHYSNICGNDSFGARNDDAGVIMPAANCYWGTGGPKSLTSKYALGDTVIGNINYTPFEKAIPFDIPLSNIDLKIKDVKTIQTVQDVNLLTRRPTMVRVFVDVGRCKKVDGVNVKLTFNGKDYYSTGNSIKGIKGWTNTELNTGVNTVNFFIPVGDVFYGIGNEVVTAEVDYSPEAVEERNETNNTGSDSVTVIASPKAWITYRPISAGRWHSLPSVNIMDFAKQNHSFVEAILPMYWGIIDFNNEVIEVDSVVTGGFYNWNTFSVMKTITRLYSSQSDHRVVGIAPKGTFSHGLSHKWYPKVVLIDSTTFPDDQWLAAHETGHVFNGTGYVLDDEYYDQASGAGNSSWPYNAQPDGSVSSEGWWIEKGKSGCIHNPHPKDYFGNRYYNFMSNSGTISHWISDSVYKVLLSNLPAKKKASVPRIAFSFNIYDNDSVFMEPCYRVEDGEADTGQAGNYKIECQNGSGGVLSSVNFEPEFVDVPSSGLKGFPCFLNLEFPAGTQKIVIKHNSNTIKEVIKSSNSPVVNLTYPNGGESLADTVRVRWSGSDIDGGQLYYWLMYSKDSVWTPVAMDLVDTTYLVNLQSLPGGTTCKFKVIVTDGMNSSSDESDGDFGSGNKAPYIVISNPVDSAIYSVDREISFNAGVYDAEDGALDDTTLKWVSSVSGLFATGQNVSASLPLGNHTIYLTGHDKDGLFSGDTIYLSVVSDTSPDVYVTPDDIITNVTPLVNDTCWIRVNINNIRKDAECVASVYLHHIDSLNLLASEFLTVEANKTASLSVRWTPLAVGSDTVWVKISEVDPVDGDTLNNVALKVFSVVAVEEKDKIPDIMFLSQNYPNPAMNSTFIRFAIPTAGKVSLKIYDVTGKLVKTMIDGECKPGNYNLLWNGYDNHNKKVSNGIYFVRLAKDNKQYTRKAVLLK